MACSSARKTACLRAEGKTDGYGLSRICFEMTRQATMPSLEGVSVTCKVADEQHINLITIYYPGTVGSL
jgi:hypothetical protein